MKEYTDIRDARYDPEIGSMGLQCSITLERPGTRIKNRKLLKRIIPVRHRVNKEDAIQFMRETFKVTLASDEKE
jgi:large subunit ribosomal protein L5